eukprot:221445_1
MLLIIILAINILAINLLMVTAGLISAFESLSDSKRNAIKTLVENGKYDLFIAVLEDNSMDTSDAMTLYGYICSILATNKDTCDIVSTTQPLSGNAAFSQLERYETIAFQGYWTNIEFEQIAFNKNIYLNNDTQNSGSIIFNFAGIYKFTVGFYGGAISPANISPWNGLRLYGVDNDYVAGKSNGVGMEGMDGGDSSQHGYSFFVDIQDANDIYYLQRGIADASSTITIHKADVWSDGSQNETPIILATIEYIGSL